MKLASGPGGDIERRLLWPIVLRFVKEPLSRLAQAARVLATGDFTSRAGIEEGPPEIVEAGRAFDAMAEALERREQVLIDSSRELLETSARLSEAQKLEAVGQLAGGVAHDFNNILTVVRGSLELLEEDALDEEQLDLISDALHAASRGEELTHRLLSYSRKQRLAPGPVDLNKLVTGMRALLERTLGDRIRVWFRLSAEAPRCTADAGQLEIVLLNLAINAREAMPEGGRVTIATGYTDGHELERPGELFTFLTVADQGVGMTRQVARRASEPFFTTKDRGLGTGLGLSGAFGFAKQSGGELNIDTAPGRGTAVRILLPAAIGARRGSPAESLSKDDAVA